MKGIIRWVILLILLLAVVVAILYLKNPNSLVGLNGDIVELTFEFDKKTEFGQYYFDLDNGEGATYPLCYCLTERNMFPPDCNGDIKYIYNNEQGTMCVPLHIAKGRCSANVISSSSYATLFLIPLEYRWTKPVEKIVMGIKIPQLAPEGSRLVVQVNFFKRDEVGRLKFFKKYEQAIRVQKKVKEQV